MGSQIEQLKNRAKEYAKAYHEKEGFLRSVKSIPATLSQC